MKIQEIYQGGENAFEGNRTLWLRSLPEGARVRTATLRLTPVAPPGGTLFQEVIEFTSNQGDWGATRSSGNGFAEVDFHARRTLAGINARDSALSGTNTVDLEVAIDMGGGVFVSITEQGRIVTGEDDEPMRITVNRNGRDTNLPGLVAAKLRLSGGTTPGVNNVVVRSVPTNVSAQLGQMPPFWLKLGEFSSAQTSPDFAEMLNIFLMTAEVADGYFQIPLTLHSDTIARLDALLEIDFVIEKSVLPPHLTEISVPYNFSTLPGVEDTLTTVTLPRGAVPVSATAQILGEFDSTRVALGEVGETLTPVIPVEIKPGSGLAQAIRFNKEVAVTGIDLPLANTAPGLAGMHISIQADSDGKPFGDVLVSAEVRVDKPLPGQSSWGSATLPAPFRLLPNVRYWLILQSQSGVAYWDAEPRQDSAEPTLQVSRNSGLSWRALVVPDAPEFLAARFRLRDTPDRFTMPVQLQIGKGPNAVRRKLNEFEPKGRIDFSFDFSDKLNEYIEQPGVDEASCGEGNFVVNGNFALPAVDDATFKLFGVTSAQDVRFEGGARVTGLEELPFTLNLSQQRMITLEINGSSPQRIDVAGAVPERTRPEEIVQAINSAVGMRVASITSARLEIRAPAVDDEETDNRSSVTLYPWCDALAPTGWTVESGHILRSAFQRVGVEPITAVTLASPPALLLNDGALVFCFEGLSDLESTLPAILGQTFAAAAGCTYELRVTYFAFAQFGDNPVAPARWRVDWLDEAGKTIQTDTGVLEPARSQLGSTASAERGLVLSENLRLVAPENAVRAHLHFIQAAPGLLTLYDVAFEPTSESLLNGNFERVEAQSVGGERLVTALEDWSIQGEIVLERGSLRLQSGADEARLTQTSPVDGDKDYVLQVVARRVGLLDAAAQPLSGAQGARLELQWLGESGAMGQPVLLPLSLDDFSRHTARVHSPTGAAQAEIRIVQPPGDNASLLVESISLQSVETFAVPLIFLAETPGQLTITGLRVSYDLPAPAAAPRPAVIQLASAQRATVSAVSPAPTSFRVLENRTVDLINGVGVRATEVLNSASIRTIGELAALEVSADIDELSPEEQLELKAAAELITGVRVEAAPFSALADRTLDDLMRMSAADLAAAAGQTEDRAVALQRQLRALHVLLKRSAFRSLTLADLAA